IIGIGGSATNDGGTGMATALGVRFLDDGGNSVPGNAENLSRIKRIDLSGMDSRLSSVTFDVACDVNNILLGPQGAAAVYGPQKGATPEQVKKIEEGLAQLASVINHDLGKDVRLIEGGGAAGGLGATLYALLNAQIKPGAELLLDILNFDDLLKDADLVITTEGRLDFQTGFGKAPSIVANRAKRLNVPTVIVCGQVESETFNWQAFGFLKVYSLSDSEISTEFAMTHTEKLLIAKSNLLINEFMMAGT
ncbi:MAG: glycerate kinase, partial [Gammaproteobacteria bacterium]|nr:glycerate kinase [Gammaproteobacteria bacterium]